MPWEVIQKAEVDNWNQRLKQTSTPFYQYPYYATAMYHSLFSECRYLKYLEEGKEQGYCVIIEINFFFAKVGIIDGGPTLLSDKCDIQKVLNELKDFAVKKRYLFLQILPHCSDVDELLKKDTSFQQKIFFPFHQIEEANFNIPNLPEERLLMSFKPQCRRKIVLAERVQYKFDKLKSAVALKDIYRLFKDVIKNKGYGYLPFSIFVNIFRNGKKHDLCDIYTASLNGEIINAVFIVKDRQSFYHLSSGLVIKGYKENESPPAKLHYLLMKDCFYVENKEYYNISYGGSENLLRFKELFNPIETPKYFYYTYVINKRIFSLLKNFTPELAEKIRFIFARIRNTFFRFKKF